MGEMGTLHHHFVCSGEERVYLMPKRNVIISSPTDILELFLITAAEKSRVKSLEPRRKKIKIQNSRSPHTENEITSI